MESTGVWTKKAIKEAKLFGEVDVLASSEDKNFTYIPKGFEIPADLDYLYICANNTIYGTEYKEDIDSPVPVIADMSSNILSRPIDVSKYAVIYGGAQKNLAPAGVSFVIVRDDMLGKVVRELPSMVNVNTHVDNNSMFNTPPVFPIYVLRETLKWMKAEGGLEVIYRRNQEKAAKLYAEIDRNSLFRGTAATEDRSSMNICFVMSEGNEALAAEFMEFAKSRGMVGIKGHRLVGGFRASCYNACSVEAVDALVACMQEFEQMHKQAMGYTYHIPTKTNPFGCDVLEWENGEVIDYKEIKTDMKVLVATEKPFAKKAVDGIKNIFAEAGYEVVLLEKYTDKAELLAAVGDVDALIVRSDKVTKEVTNICM